MSLQVVAKHIEPPEPEGTDEGGDCGVWVCQQCEGAEFRLSEWRGYPVVVCVGCGKPQDSVTWIGAGDE
jgi:hypothetical protein